MEEFLDERRKYSRRRDARRRKYAQSHPPEVKAIESKSRVKYTSKDADSDMDLIMQTAALKMVSTIRCRLPTTVHDTRSIHTYMLNDT